MPRRPTSWPPPTGTAIDAIHIVGGGANHRLLCQLTADATGLPVRAGPVEATAIGNLAVQAIAAGELASVGEARELAARSFPITTYEPTGDWSDSARALCRADGTDGRLRLSTRRPAMGKHRRRRQARVRPGRRARSTGP